jgi:hypothetical protein
VRAEWRRVIIPVVRHLRRPIPNFDQSAEPPLGAKRSNRISEREGWLFASAPCNEDAVVSPSSSALKPNSVKRSSVCSPISGGRTISLVLFGFSPEGGRQPMRKPKAWGRMHLTSISCSHWLGVGGFSVMTRERLPPQNGSNCSPAQRWIFSTWATRDTAPRAMLAT